MRIIKLAIGSILCLAIIITIISLFIPSEVQVSQAIRIHTSEKSVMDQLGDPVKWKNWYPGADSSKFLYENGTIRGLVLNEGRQKNIVINEKKNDEVTAFYELPDKKIRTGWLLAAEKDSNSVTVMWHIDFHLRWYPWEKFTSFMFEKVYEPQMQQGLKNLKAFLETHP